MRSVDENDIEKKIKRDRKDECEIRKTVFEHIYRELNYRRKKWNDEAITFKIKPLNSSYSRVTVKSLMKETVFIQSNHKEHWSRIKTK